MTSIDNDEPDAETTKRVLVLDGGMGRELLRIGAPFQQPEWSALALMESPEHVTQAHLNFIDAGADIITTNSYALVPFHIGERPPAEIFDLAALSGQLAREAVEQSEDNRWIRVAGCLPPLFGSYRPDLFDAELADLIIDPIISGLRKYVDLWLGETLSSIAEATAVGEALDRWGIGNEQPLLISFTVNDAQPGILRSGESVSDAVKAAIELGASAVLFNCAPAEMISAAIEIAIETADGAISVGGYANRFADSHDDGETAANETLSELRADMSADDYAVFVSRWVAAGATIIGGCCGMDPTHIKSVADIAALS